MLKKPSTSSVDDALGCSSGILFSLQYFLSHSRLSMFTIKAERVFRVNPRISLRSLAVKHDFQYIHNMVLCHFNQKTKITKL